MSGRSRVSGAFDPLEELTLELHCVVYEEGDDWLAHFLECDVVSFGESPQAAMAAACEALDTLLDYAFQRGDLRPVFRPAPYRFWQMFNEAKRIPGPRMGKIPKKRSPSNRFRFEAETVAAG